MNTQRLGSDWGFCAVVFTHCDSGRRCRVPCLDREEAMQVAGELFDIHYGVQIVDADDDGGDE